MAENTCNEGFASSCFRQDPTLGYEEQEMVCCLNGSNLQLLWNENVHFSEGGRESMEYRGERETKAQKLVWVYGITCAVGKQSLITWYT